jgi:hypothetical protein
MKRPEPRIDPSAVQSKEARRLLEDADLFIRDAVEAATNSIFIKPEGGPIAVAGELCRKTSQLRRTARRLVSKNIRHPAS